MLGRFFLSAGIGSLHTPMRMLIRTTEAEASNKKKGTIYLWKRTLNANTTQAIYAHQIARARAEASGVRAGVFSILKEA